MKKVIFFGQSNVTEEATRNIVLCAAFDAHTDRSVDCTIQFGFAQPGTTPMLKVIYAILSSPLRWAALLSKYYFAEDHDFIFVPYPSYMDGWLACLLGKMKNKKVVIDAFLGIYDTVIRDRCLFKQKSLIARLIWHYEKKFLAAADYILVDTELNGEMLREDYRLPESKIKIIPVGIDETLWKPVRLSNTPKFKVVFWCTFIPLHGAEVVARAAQLIEGRTQNIEFIIIGTGQLSERFGKLLNEMLLSNLKWIAHFISLEAIYKHVKESHCCLGIFGNTDKSHRVIPYKVYQALASGRPVITARTKASQGLLTHRENALLVTPDAPEELADAILALQADAELSRDLGEKGRATYETCLSNNTINRKIGELLAQG